MPWELDVPETAQPRQLLGREIVDRVRLEPALLGPLPPGLQLLRQLCHHLRVLGRQIVLIQRVRRAIEKSELGPSLGRVDALALSPVEVLAMITEEPGKRLLDG